MFYAVGTILLVLGLLFWNYGTYAINVVGWCKPLDIQKGKPIKRPRLSAGESFTCFLPIYQVCAVRKALYGTYGWTAPVGIISGLLIVVRLINAFLFPINGYVMLVTTFMMWAGLLLYFLLYGIVSMQCARMYEFSFIYSVIVFLFPQIACMHMRDRIASKMRAMHKEEVFDEHRGDTVIKSRHNK